MHDRLPGTRSRLIVPLFAFALLGSETDHPHIAQTQDDDVYAQMVFETCPYEVSNVSELSWETNMGADRRLVGSQEDALAEINALQGRSIWLGYQDQVPRGAPWGFDMPDEVYFAGQINLTLMTNLVDGQVYSDDPTMVVFLRSEDTNEVYVFAFLSVIHQFARSNGDNQGSHLCGAYAISEGDFDKVRSLFSENPDFTLHD